MSTVPQYHPEQHYPPMPRQPKNGLGTAGFVLGLIGLVFSFIPIIGLIAWPLAILGLVFAILGVVRANKGTANNKGLSVAGVVVSAIALVVCVLWLAVFGKAASDINDNRLQFDQQVSGGHTVEFVVSGNQPVNVSYGDVVDTRQILVQPGTQWHKTAGYLGGEHLMNVNASLAQPSADGQVSCSITVDGRKVAEQSNALGLALCTANVG